MRYQVIKMPKNFIAEFVVVDTNRHPKHFTEITHDDLETGRVELFDFEDEALAQADFANYVH